MQISAQEGTKWANKCTVVHGKVGDVMDSSHDTGRRIRAAMELAGINGFSELAERVNQKGLGERTLRKLADPAENKRQVTQSDLLAIANATGLPLEFFIVSDRELLAALVGTNPDLEPRVRRLEAALQDLPERGEERLTALERSLTALRVELARTALVRAAQADEASPQKTEDPLDEDQNQGRSGGDDR